MRCEEFKSNLIEAMAGGDSVLGTHSQECASCAKELAEFRKTFDLLDEWAAPDPSPYFDTRLKARLREEAAQPVGWKAKWFRYMRLPALAGAMAAVALGGLSVYRSQIAPPLQHQCAVTDVQSLDKNYDLLGDLDSLDDSSDQPSDTEL
jgi:anti-sigma factor RsiW